MKFLLRKKALRGIPYISHHCHLFFKPVSFFAERTQNFCLFFWLFCRKLRHFLVPFLQALNSAAMPKNWQISGMQTDPRNFFSKEKVFRGCGLIRRLSNFGNYWLANFPEASFQSTLLQILSCEFSSISHFLSGPWGTFDIPWEIWSVKMSKNQGAWT